MKKILAILFTIFLAYITSYYTTDASKNQEPFDFESNQAFYKIMCFITGETDTTDANALIKEAEYFYDYQSYDLALENYNKALKLDSTQGYVNLMMADCYMALNDTDKAILVLEDYAKIAEYKYEVLNKLGEIHLNIGNLNRAEVSFIEAASISEDSHQVQANLCNVYTRKKDYKKALEYIINAINIYSENTEYINTRRRLYLKLNEPDLAKADYERILAIDPYFFPDYADKAKSAKEEGDIQSAIEYYKLALEFEPDNKDYINSRGWLYYELQQYDSAYYDFDKLVKLEPEYYYYYFSRAYVLDGLGRIEESIEDYTKSISFKDDYYQSYNNRGYEYYQLKKYEEAEKDYTKSIELKPDYYLHYLNRGLLYYEQEKYEKRQFISLKLFQKLMV